MAEFGWTQADRARRIGKDRSSIANALRLRRLPGVIQEDLRAGRLSMGHARALLGLSTAGAPPPVGAANPGPGRVLRGGGSGTPPASTERGGRRAPAWCAIAR